LPRTSPTKGGEGKIELEIEFSALQATLTIVIKDYSVWIMETIKDAKMPIPVKRKKKEHIPRDKRGICSIGEELGAISYKAAR